MPETPKDHFCRNLPEKIKSSPPYEKRLAHQDMQLALLKYKLAFLNVSSHPQFSKQEDPQMQYNQQFQISEPAPYSMECKSNHRMINFHSFLPSSM